LLCDVGGYLVSVLVVGGSGKLWRKVGDLLGWQAGCLNVDYCGHGRGLKWNVFVNVLLGWRWWRCGWCAAGGALRGVVLNSLASFLLGVSDDWAFDSSVTGGFVHALDDEMGIPELAAFGRDKNDVEILSATVGVEKMLLKNFL
jgi:hypothetical protein